MAKKEYIFKNHKDKIINVLVIKNSENRKLGYGEKILGTYHFTTDQVSDCNLLRDKETCMDCPMSYNSGDGSCYTHFGLQRLGLNSMLKRLKRLLPTIKRFNQEGFDKFITNAKGLDLVRFGVYGEPVLLPFKMVETIIDTANTAHTGYTHQWAKPSYQQYSKYFMASTHSKTEALTANAMGWRAFNTGRLDVKGVNCLASKEAGRKATCAQCALCGGTTKASSNIWILKH